MTKAEGIYVGNRVLSAMSQYRRDGVNVSWEGYTIATGMHIVVPKHALQFTMAHRMRVATGKTFSPEKVFAEAVADANKNLHVFVPASQSPHGRWAAGHNGRLCLDEVDAELPVSFLKAIEENPFVKDVCCYAVEPSEITPAFGAGLELLHPTHFRS